MVAFHRRHNHGHGHDHGESGQVPVVLPHVRIVVDEAGTLAVSLDDQPVTPDGDAVWTRDDVAHVLDAVTRDRTVAVRIEVRESDGSVFTDIIHARRPRPSEITTQLDEVAPHGNGEQPQRPRLVEVSGDGFVPGEDVAVAVIVSHTDATGTGAARALVDLDRLTPLLRSGPGEVILFGRISGTMHVEAIW